MKRDLKFRLTDILTKKSEIFELNNDFDCISGWMTSKKIDQFTGLKDCNGVDIYEGNYDQDHQVVVWCERRLGWSLFTYDFPTKEFIHCNCYCCEGNYELNECLDKFKVIGNIHQL